MSAPQMPSSGPGSQQQNPVGQNYQAGQYSPAPMSGATQGDPTSLSPQSGTPWSNPYAWTGQYTNQYANNTNVPTGYPGQQGLLPPQPPQGSPLTRQQQTYGPLMQLIGRYMGATGQHLPSNAFANMPAPPQGAPITSMGMPGPPQFPQSNNPLAGHRLFN